MIDNQAIRKALINIIVHERTAIATIAVAVFIAIADGLRSGHVVWSTVGYAALTALAAVARSALGIQAPPPPSTDASAG